MVAALEAEGGTFVARGKSIAGSRDVGRKGQPHLPTIACKPQQTADVAGFSIPDDRKFLMVENQGQIGPEHKFSKEKLTTLMALYHFETFDDALDTVAAIYNRRQRAFLRHLQPQRRQHRRLARLAPGQPDDGAPAAIQGQCGSWTNGMPMTSSLGCGVWGGNITNENVTMKHMMNYTWVARPIAEDRPSEEELVR